MILLLFSFLIPALSLFHFPFFCSIIYLYDFFCEAGRGAAMDMNDELKGFLRAPLPGTI